MTTDNREANKQWKVVIDKDVFSSFNYECVVKNDKQENNLHEYYNLL